MLIEALIPVILEQYRLPVFGIHGIGHWARVLDNGLRLAEDSGADPAVIRYFAIFHDSRRQNESVDPGHGVRGARLARELRAQIDLPNEDFERLVLACEGHTTERFSPDVVIQTCWDADRLDLLRAGIQPHPKFLGTELAKDPRVIEWANQRSLKQVVPDYVYSVWLDGKPPEEFNQSPGRE